jgi:hypothetical protein
MLHFRFEAAKLFDEAERAFADEALDKADRLRRQAVGGKQAAYFGERDHRFRFNVISESGGR